MVKDPANSGGEFEVCKNISERRHKFRKCHALRSTHFLGAGTSNLAVWIPSACSTIPLTASTVTMGASRWMFNAGRIFAIGAVFFFPLALSSPRFAGDHASRPRVLQASSSIVWINAVVGTPMGSAEEDAIQLQASSFIPERQR